MADRIAAIRHHQTLLRRCTRCSDMSGPPVTGNPVMSPVMVVGQAPGVKEIELRRPFAWSAGKTLFGWFSQIGLAEPEFRQRVYMTAVCRCFPGKARSGDRIPTAREIANCAAWLQRELDLLQPELIVPLGRLAIRQFVPASVLTDVVGQRWPFDLRGRCTDVIPLPHPSGASTWHRTEPGKSLLHRALSLISSHPAWVGLLKPHA
jgi:uracil-DNA glycosylase